MNSVSEMDCIFCKIIAGQLGTKFLAENEYAVAFKDIHPQAKVHILVVPRQHTANISQLEDPQVLSGFFELIRKVSNQFTDGQFRLQFNTGEREGQSVYHTHAHVLSQRDG